MTKTHPFRFKPRRRVEKSGFFRFLLAASILCLVLIFTYDLPEISWFRGPSLGEEQREPLHRNARIKKMIERGDFDLVPAQYWRQAE